MKKVCRNTQVAALSSASCSESLGWCLKVNTINSIYFSFAPLFFVLSPTLPPSNPQTSPFPSSDIPPFIPTVPPFTLFHLLFLASFLSSFPPPLFPSISLFWAYICLETSLSPDFFSGRLYSHYLSACVFTVVTTHWNESRMCVCACVCFCVPLCACSQRSSFQWNDSSAPHSRKATTNNMTACVKTYTNTPSWQLSHQ